MALPDLDDLIAEVDRTCATAHPGNGSRDQPDWIELLKAAAGIASLLQALGNDLVEEYVEHCRMHGSSWADIGEALGVTRQAVQQRFLAPPKEYEPSEFSDELHRAMAAMKQVAVHHRNNYIGTEHVLWGITAETNTATRLLASLGVSVESVRQSLDQRITLGASQAAERIAWTPYSRKAMALAKDLATRTDSPTIGCDHLLAGLIRLGRGAAAAVLRDLGIDEPALDACAEARPRRRAPSRSTRERH